VAASRKGLDLVALDRERSIVTTKSRLTVDEVVETVVSLRATVVCIDSPSGWAISDKSRLAERQLARLGIQAYYTGQDPGDHPFYAWMRVGMQIYERLAGEYPLYRGGEVAGHAAEIFPHASAALLANCLPARDQKEPFGSARYGEAGPSPPDQVGPTEQDVGRLVDRIGEHERTHRRPTDRRELIFDRRVAGDLGDGH
jgi:hypothetical protein